MLSKLRTILACTIAVFALTAAASAQIFATAAVIPVAGSPQAMATGDFNRDHHQDIVYQDAYAGGNLHVLLGKGDGTFTTGQVIPLADGIGTNITVGDLNGDGIPDLVLGYYGFDSTVSTAVTVLLGRGDGTFSSPMYTPISTPDYPAQFIFKVGIADFDGDGHPDIIMSDFSGYLYFLKGDGKGHFATPVLFPGSTFQTDVLVADLNGDGRPDFVTASNYAFDVYINQGNATFAPPVSYATDFYSSGQNSLLLADINGDDHPDVLYGNDAEQLLAAYGRSDGTFAVPTVIAKPPSHVPALLGVADLNGDHKPRVLLSSSDGVAVTLGATPNGSELFAAAGYYFEFSVAADFNDDGLIDVAVPADNAIAILFGKSDGTFIAAPSVQTDGAIGGITVLDDTNDGIPDVVLSQGRIYPGKGDGTFGPPLGTGGSDPGLAYSGEFDGTGHLGFYYYEGIFHNDGDGTFTSQYLNFYSYAPFPTNYAVVADFNLDGRADVALSLYGSGQNDPTTGGYAVGIASSAAGGTYTLTGFAVPEPVGPLGAGDFNGDTCPDLAIGAATQIEIYLGDCTGNFQPGAAYPTNTGATVTSNIAGLQDSLDPSDIAVADLDGDGHLDIIYTVPGLSLAKVLYGNGDGTFVAGEDLKLPHSSLFVTEADLNSDGNADLIFSGENLVTLYYGNHSRSFGTPTLLAAGYATGKSVVADLNRDGNPDIVIPNLDFDYGDDSDDSGYTFTVFLNQLAKRTSADLTPSLIVSPEPSAFGQPFTATAHFVPVSNPAVPTGTATFTLDGGSPLTATLSSSGYADVTYPSASVGTHVVAVNYPGNVTFDAASAKVNHVVTGYGTGTTLTCAAAPIYVGDTTLLTATVTSSNGTPTGYITFADNTTTLGQVALSNGKASLTYTATAYGRQVITATYVPTGAFAASSTTCALTVLALPTISTLTVTPASITFGTPVTLSATVVPATPPGPSVPAGNLTFYNGGIILNTAVLSNGAATFTTSSLPAGTDGLTCIYAGSTIYAVSNCNTVNATITAAASTLTLTSSANPSPALTPLTFTAHLTANGQPAPAGNTILLSLNGQIISLTTDATGSASFTTPGLIPDTYPVAASFAATSTLLATTASLSEQVNPNPTITTLAISPATGQQGQPVTLSATVTATLGSAHPDGAVEFFDSATLLGSAPVAASNGTASIASFSATALTVGSHSLSAVYVPGSTSFLPSQSTQQPFNVAFQGFTITAAQNPMTLESRLTGTNVLTLTSLGGFTAPITVTCPPSMPPAATCSLSASTVQLPPNGTVTTTLKITTEMTSGDTFWTLLRSTPPGVRRSAFASILPLAFFALIGLRRRRNKLRIALAFACLAILSSTLSACGPGQTVATYPGTYPLTFTAAGTAQGSSTPTTHTLYLPLIVTPYTQ